MTDKELQEIKARLKRNTSTVDKSKFGLNILTRDSEISVCTQKYTGNKVTIDKEMECMEHNAEFISNAPIDISTLIAAYETLQSENTRLCKENEGLRANSAIQEHIIENGGNPMDKDKIIRLTMENTRLKADLVRVKDECRQIDENAASVQREYKAELERVKAERDNWISLPELPKEAD